jgi:undecaprenyl diphosphate synthase
MADTPLHLAIIPDGNRRWAKTQGWLPWKGHESAMENVWTLIEWCRNDSRIGVLSIWGFSTENWKRSDEEVDKLMEIFENFLISQREEFLRLHIRLVHSGRRDRLPQSLLTLIDALAEETKGEKDFTFQLCLDFGGKDETVQAVQRVLAARLSITEESVRSHLDHPELPDIDLILRTSGEQRTSGFSLWQGAYAEWMFLQKHFPELTPEDLNMAVTAFAKRTRRFGGG